MKVKRKELKQIITDYLGPKPLNESLALIAFMQALDIKDEAMRLHGEAIDLSADAFAIYPHRDAFRHIVGYGFLVHWIKQTLPGAGYVGKLIGEAYELKGALRSFVKGGPFDSGWEMDSANNDIGFDLGLSLDSKQAIVDKARALVAAGDFYVEDGKTMFAKCPADKSIGGCKITPPKSGSGKSSNDRYRQDAEKYKIN